jgi:alcohol dehydrogenase class IV
MPLAATGTCGLDALVQLIEAYVSRKSTPYVRAIVLGAFPHMLRALQGLPAALEDMELRSAASWGALVSGLALANAGLGAAHGFAAGLGGMYEIPHGLLCAVFMPAVLEANASCIGGGIGELARAAGVNADDPVAWLAAEMRRLLAAFHLPADLGRYAIPRSTAGELAERSMGSSMKGNPRDLSAGERRDIIASVL